MKNEKNDNILARIDQYLNQGHENNMTGDNIEIKAEMDCYHACCLECCYDDCACCRICYWTS